MMLVAVRLARSTSPLPFGFPTAVWCVVTPRAAQCVSHSWRNCGQLSVTMRDKGEWSLKIASTLAMVEAAISRLPVQGRSQVKREWASTMVRSASTEGSLGQGPKSTKSK